MNFRQEHPVWFYTSSIVVVCIAVVAVIWTVGNYSVEAAKINAEKEIKRTEIEHACKPIDTSARKHNHSPMCNRYQQAAMQEAKDALAAIIETPFNIGSEIVHPQSPGLVVRQENGQRILNSMTWGFPLILADAKARAAANGSCFPRRQRRYYPRCWLWKTPGFSWNMRCCWHRTSNNCSS